MLIAAASAGAASSTLLVFGDSLSASYGISPQQGWVQLLANRIQRAGLPWQVANASISGETTAGGLRRLPEDLKRHHPSVVAIELDDSTLYPKDRAQRDAFMNELFRVIGVALIHQRVQIGYDPAAIARWIDAAVARSGGPPLSTTPLRPAS